MTVLVPERMVTGLFAGGSSFLATCGQTCSGMINNSVMMVVCRVGVDFVRDLGGMSSWHSVLSVMHHVQEGARILSRNIYQLIHVSYYKPLAGAQWQLKSRVLQYILILKHQQSQKQTRKLKILPSIPLHWETYIQI